jgi:hypothetical protein
MRETSAITGEWAWPAVFEMEGGEPGIWESENSNPNKPALESCASTRGWAERRCELAPDQDVFTTGSDRDSLSLKSLPIAHDYSDEGRGQPSPALEDAARWEAFAQLNENPAVLVRSSSVDDARHGWKDFTVLMLALAMERMVARGFREPGGKARTVSERPRRSPEL